MLYNHINHIIQEPIEETADKTSCWKDGLRLDLSNISVRQHLNLAGC